MTTLVVVHDAGIVAGSIEEDRRGRRTFVYDDTWHTSDDAVALSVSLPLATREHVHARIDPWLWGLLPDNEAVLERWGRSFQVSARNPFRLLAHVGEDCAGAFALLTEDRVAAFCADTGRVQPIDEAQIGARLAAVRADPARTRTASDRGQFSLAGAQPKIALAFDGRRWSVPSGRAPTTHILKPPTGELDGLAENEHFCLRLAAALGLPAARSEVCRFDGELAIVVERFDRMRSSASRGRRVVRVHQEDLCQALALHPASKYQSDGGPTPRAVAEVLRAHSGAPRQDVETFFDALVFSWLTGGTDAHAKNYALLHGPRGRVRLAPLYDLASVLPYAAKELRRQKLAMKFGGEYHLEAILPRHVDALAAEVGLRPAAGRDRARTQAERLVDLAPAVAREVAAEGVRHPIVRALAASIGARAASRARALAG